MCEFFSCVVTANGDILWTSTDHHHYILSLTDFEDENQFVDYACIECVPKCEEGIQHYKGKNSPGWEIVFDSPLQMPEWWKAKYTTRVKQLAERIRKFCWINEDTKDKDTVDCTYDDWLKCGETYLDDDHGYVCHC